MPDANALAKYYESLTNSELLNLKKEGGFTDEAAQVLASELRRRNLDSSALARYEAHGKGMELHEEATEKGDRFWGPGLLFFGRSYLNEEDRRANIQVRTKWFALGGIPLVPIASYRFQCRAQAGKWSNSDGPQKVLDRVVLDWSQVFVTWLKTAAIVAAVVLVGAVIVGYENHWKF